MGWKSSAGWLVRFVGLAPSADLIRQMSMSVVPSRPGLSLVKAIFLPSGEKVGEKSLAGLLERSTGRLVAP